METNEKNLSNELNKAENPSRTYKIAVAGTGYVGLPLSVLLAQHHQVTAVDIIQEKADMISNRRFPIQDDYLEKYLSDDVAGVRKLKLTATLDIEATYKEVDFALLLAPTNYDSNKYTAFCHSYC